MISFNLKCSRGHRFEGWFSSSDDYQHQCDKGLVACPICDDSVISKALMTPNVAAKSNAKAEQAQALTPVPAPAPASVPAPTPKPAPTPMQHMPTHEQQEAMAEAYRVVRSFQSKVEAECDYVGDKFAEEARKIHYGEVEPRGIYGQSSPDDATALEEEGISIASIPWLPPEN